MRLEPYYPFKECSKSTQRMCLFLTRIFDSICRDGSRPSNEPVPAMLPAERFSVYNEPARATGPDSLWIRYNRLRFVRVSTFVPAGVDRRRHVVIGLAGLDRAVGVICTGN